MSDDPRIDDVVARVYDAALDETLWSGIATAIAKAFDSTSAIIDTRGATSGEYCLDLTQNLLESVEIYRAYYWQRDVWIERARELGLSGVFASKDLISDSELLRTEFYFDCLRQSDHFYVVGSVFPIDRDQLGALGIHRPQRGKTYTDADKQRVGTFVPHLQRALQLRRRLGSLTMERQAALDALERTGMATLVVTRTAQLLYANTQAENLLRQGDALRVAAGRLSAIGKEAGARLIRAVRDAVDVAAQRNGGLDTAMTVRRGERLPLTVLIAPFRPARDGFGAPIPAAIIFIRDPETQSPSLAGLRALFGLTAAEASIASGIAEGRSLEAIAAARAISPNTAKTHLKSVFAKTEAKRRGELIALILGSVAALGQ